MTGYQMQADFDRASGADEQERERREGLTPNPETCRHTQAYWDAEQDCASCGADPAPEEEPAPAESP
jgi:hypothetical protein